jgi:cytochrome c oxidase assembly protein subunit 15
VIIGPVSSGCEHRFFKSATSTASVPLRSSSHPSSDAAPPPLSPPIVSKWLLFSASLVFGIVVVGGVTRLTESGLSIVEWRPITGTVPPLSHVDWEGEFEKYKLTPEFIMSVWHFHE